MKEKIKQKGFIQIPILIVIILIVVAISVASTIIVLQKQGKLNPTLDSVPQTIEDSQSETEQEVENISSAIEKLNQQLKNQQVLEEQRRQEQTIKEEQERLEQARISKIENYKKEADAIAELSASQTGKKASDEIIAEYLQSANATGSSQTFSERIASLGWGLKMAQEIAQMAYDDAYSREYSRVYLITYSNCLNE